MVSGFFTRFGEFDHLVHTAAGSTDLPVEPTAAEGRAFFETALWGACTTVRRAATRIRPNGSIVLSSGAAGVRPRRGVVSAAAVSGAAEAVVRAVGLAPVRVNVVRPGPTRTGMWDRGPVEADELSAASGAELLLGRVGRPQDTAEAYVCLVEQTFSTGTVVTVDGGDHPGQGRHR